MGEAERLLAAAVPPSTARKALVMATDILLSSNRVTVPLRLMTLSSPGAVACRRPLVFASLLSMTEAGGLVDVAELVPVCILWVPRLYNI